MEAELYSDAHRVSGRIPPQLMDLCCFTSYADAAYKSIDFIDFTW